MNQSHRIIRPATAFSLSTGRKRPRKESGDHLKFIRSLPCCVCGTHKQVEAAHIRIGSQQFGKPWTGAGEKPSDEWTVPLCAWDHRTAPSAQHMVGEESFWFRHKINPFVLALALWRATGDTEAGELIIQELRTP